MISCLDLLDYPQLMAFLGFDWFQVLLLFTGHLVQLPTRSNRLLIINGTQEQSYYTGVNNKSSPGVVDHG